MSLHAITPEAQAAMQRQRRNAVISSAVIATLTIILLMLVLSLFLLAPQFKEVPTIVTYVAENVDEEQVQEQKIQQQVEKPPSAPAASMTKVITSTAITTMSVPTVETNVTTPSVDFGTSADFGDGWDNGFSSSGGGGATFFQQKVSANRIAYVIDYSQSMGGQRDALMREELKKSISNLPPTIDYQMVFFAGPSWVAGDDVKVGKGASTIEHDGKKIEWVGNGAHDWKLKDKNAKLPQPEWLSAKDSQIKKSLKIIDEHKLFWGTAWGPAVTMALNMEPAPQIIFFMTDGDAGPSSMRVAEELAETARKKNIIINTVALMEPKAAKSMEFLADETGGEFTMIGADGKPMKKKADK